MKTQKRLLTTLFGFALIMGMISLTFTSCGGNAGKSEDSEENAAKVDDAVFYETQPVHSGLYDATYYDITGKNPRKGQFDGRVFFSLSPEMSAVYVFENGNRTKIDVMLTLQKPFEKTDSGVYVSHDAKERLVTLRPDSTNYVLDFQHGEDTYNITFDSKPRYEGSALDILEKIAAQRKKENGR